MSNIPDAAGTIRRSVYWFRRTLHVISGYRATSSTNISPFYFRRLSISSRNCQTPTRSAFRRWTGRCRPLVRSDCWPAVHKSTNTVGQDTAVPDVVSTGYRRPLVGSRSTPLGLFAQIGSWWTRRKNPARFRGNLGGTTRLVSDHESDEWRVSRATNPRAASSITSRRERLWRRVADERHSWTWTKRQQSFVMIYDSDRNDAFIVKSHG